MIPFDIADPFGPTRRSFLRELGGSVGLLGLTSYLQAADAPVASAAPGKPHFKARAKRVIFLFMAGGPSHLDMFDPKPALDKHAGKRPGATDLRTERVTGGVLPSPFAFKPGGKSGLPVSDLLPNLRDCADELCVLRGVHASNPNHSPAANFLASGSTPSIPASDRGSRTAWVPRTRTCPASSLSEAGSARPGSSGAVTCPASSKRPASPPPRSTPRR